VSDYENIDGVTEWDLLVQRIREMDDPEATRAQAMRDARSFDDGWKAACRHLESDLRENKRQFGRRLEDRIHNEYAGASRKAIAQDLLVAGILLIAVATLFFLSKGI
jgi:hypothetical protein